MQVIGQFNKMISNKFVWTAFSILVVVAFVAMDAFSGGAGARKEPDAGTLWGEKVPFSEFYDAKSGINPLRGDMLMDKTEQNELAWQRVGLTRYAKRLGLTVPDKEIGEWIRQQDAFKDTSGAYSRAQHEALAKQQFSGSRYPMKELDSYLAREFLQEKMLRTLNDITWISPLEMREEVQRLTDTFTVSYAEITPSNLTETVEVTEKEVKDYFENNKDNYQTAVQRRVNFIEIPYAEFTNGVTVTDDQIEAYYEENKASEFFQTVDTNTGTLSLRPLEEMRPMLEEFLAQELTIDLAKNAANNIVDTMIPDYDGNADTIQVAAAAANRSVNTSSWFSMYNFVPELDVGRSFNEAAFELDPEDPNRRFTLPISGASAYYVISFAEEKSPEVPPFDDVADEVKEDAQSFKNRKALRTFAEKALETYRAEAKAGNVLSNAVDGIVMTDLEPFGLIDTPEELMVREIAEGLGSRQSGEFLDVVSLGDSFKIVYLRNRTPGSAEGTEMLQQNIAMASNRLLTQSVFSGLPDFILENGKLTTGMELPGDKMSETDDAEDTSEVAEPAIAE